MASPVQFRRGRGPTPRSSTGSIAVAIVDFDVHHAMAARDLLERSDRDVLLDHEMPPIRHGRHVGNGSTTISSTVRCGRATGGDKFREAMTS